MRASRHILIPTDFSAAASHAVDYGFDLAARLGARIDLLHASVVPVLPFLDGQQLAGPLTDEWHRTAEQNLKRTADARRPTGRLDHVLLKFGDARTVIVTVARELNVDLILMATHGRRGMPRPFMGSVAEAVVRTAPCPVLTVPAPADSAASA